MAIITAISIVVISTAVLIQYLNHYLYYGRPFQKVSKYDKYFSRDYYEAREKFREAVRQHQSKHRHSSSSKTELHSLKIDVREEENDNVSEEDITIDIAILRRSKSKLLIHVSGTHGVEGFAGSSIQYSLLDDDDASTIGITPNDHDDDALPTLMFVHAMNPYGFAKLRRVNENNVDLNRNFLSKQQFDKVIARDPNHSNYVDQMEMINPTGSLETRWDFFYLRAIFAIALHGFNSLKQSLVTGNYHFPKTLFYGGQELQPSYVKLKDFITTHFDLENMKTVGIIDVHTGLGPSGFDSVVHQGVGLKKAINIFGGPNNQFVKHLVGTDQKQAISENHDDENTNLVGYDDVVGFLGDGLTEHVFPQKAKVYSIVQEFGTLPGLLVFKALRAENAMFQYDPSNRSPKYAQDLCDAFYFRNNPEWKDKVILRGRTVFHQLQLHLSSTN